MALGKIEVDTHTNLKENVATAHAVLDDIIQRFDLDQGSQTVIDSRCSLTTAYDIFNGDATLEDTFGIDTSAAQFGFMVPARGEFAEEAELIWPMINDLYATLRPDQSNLAEIQFAFRELLQILPPMVLGTYAYDDTPDSPLGLLVYSPQDLNQIYEDRLLLDNSLQRDTLKAARNSVNTTAEFFKDISPEATHIGLGATLPALTHRGTSLPHKQLEMLPTTGHRMTILAMEETLTTILEVDKRDVQEELTIGILGAGNIGEAISHSILHKYSNAKLIIYEKDLETRQTVQDVLSEKYGEDRFVFAGNADEVINETSYIVSAVTTPVDISPDTNLDGKVWLDDSEPSSIDAEELYKRGGIFVKPLFDISTTNIQRMGLNYAKGTREEYNYGWTRQMMDGHFGPGLIGPTSVFGCEAEALLAALMFDRRNEIILFGQKITPSLVNKIRGIPAKYGVCTIPEKLQGAGRYVYDDLKASISKRSKANTH